MGDVHFTIQKLLPMAGYRLLEELRPGLTEAMGSAPAGANETTVLIGMFGAFPPDRVERAREVLFRNVYFTSPAAPGSRMVLAGEEELAFKDLTPVHVGEVLVRAFIVNFRDSWSVLLSRVPEIAAVWGSAPPAQ